MLIRHDWKMVRFMSQYYAGIDTTIERQARLETVTHIALDKGLLNLTDVRLMSDLTRIIEKRGGRRALLSDRSPGARGKKGQGTGK